ncbi:hypothetical protein ACFYYR_18555 [Streptomyces sp. NPDC001922]|uniref:hypothetical protein n=1 Tax=Streptomyces sp. NPDC001922 TaxID=3364624 RepID=UPI003678D55A
MHPASLAAGPGRRGSGTRPGGSPATRPLPLLAAVAAAFTLAQLVLVMPGLGLGWDESVYISQVSPHAPAAFFSAPRARGISFLVAPVTGLTTSVTALRVYLAVLSGLGLLLALWVWRRLLPAPVLALAGALFASLWITLYYGPQAMPNLWVAYGALVATGCFLRAVRSRPAGTGEDGPVDGPVGTRRNGAVPVGPDRPAGGVADGVARFAAGVPGRPDRRALVGLGCAVAFTALMRPADALWLALPLAGAALCVRAWRRPVVLLVLAAGALVGSAEWIIEAYVRYGGLFARLERAGEVQGGMGLHFAVDDQVRALEGRSLCRPCAVPWRHPATAAWWFALPLLAAGGVVAAARARRTAVALLPVVTGLFLAVPYLLLIDYAAPRFLLPVYALLALPVALCLVSLVAGVRPGLRPVVVGVLVLALAGHLAVQYAVLRSMVSRARVTREAVDRIAAGLHRQGVRAPCVISGHEAVRIAFRTGCSSRQIRGNDRSITPAELLDVAGRRPVVHLGTGNAPPPSYARGWRVVPLPPLSGQGRYRAWVSPSAEP